MCASRPTGALLGQGVCWVQKRMYCKVDGLGQNHVPSFTAQQILLEKQMYASLWINLKMYCVCSSPPSYFACTLLIQLVWNLFTRTFIQSFMERQSSSLC